MNNPRSQGKPLLEVACFNSDSAFLAAAAGADRIELCKNYSLGGLTPDLSTLAMLKSQLQIPVYVMIRPTADTFSYDSADFEQMGREIDMFNQLGADGFVFGILHHPSENSRSLVDVARNRALVQRAKGRACTFHRAFDLVPESQWDAALRDIRDCGFSAILTNGGPTGNAAVECVDKLATLVQWTELHGVVDANGRRLPEIMVGGGVRASNIGLLRDRTRAGVFHSAALLRDGDTVSTDEVRKIREALRE
ncbi:copper homeostasis CutC domain-containing protein [Aspergillus nidulans var. acristatus]